MKKIFLIFICVYLSCNIYAQNIKPKLGQYQHIEKSPIGHGCCSYSWSLDLKNKSEFTLNFFNDQGDYWETYTSYGKYYIKKDTLFLLSPRPSNKITISSEKEIADSLVSFSFDCNHVEIPISKKRQKEYIISPFTFYTISKDNTTTEIKPLFIETENEKYVINKMNNEETRFDYEIEHYKDAEYEGSKGYDGIVYFYFNRKEIKSYLQAIDIYESNYRENNVVIKISDNKASNYKVNSDRIVGVTEEYEEPIIFLDVSTYKFLLKDGHIISINQFWAANRYYNLDFILKE